MRLIILDRDGVLNKLIVRPDGSLDSPMSLDEIEIFPWVIEQLKILNKKNYGLVIATNQPAAAKGKIPEKKLFEIYNKIYFDIYNGIIKRENRTDVFDTFACWHKSEDNCNCRKPKTGLLDQIFEKYPQYDKTKSWMVGDRATDVICGKSYGLKTALLGPSDESDMDVLKKLNITPTYIGKDLRDFVKLIS
jgi:D-glycero-D-manno-heptose 1,7-bisphosphate phosphatase